RRLCVHELARRSAAREVQPGTEGKALEEATTEEMPRAELGLESLEEVAKLLKKLPGREREVVRLYYLEGRTYEEISTELGIPVNSIGPVLSRARRKLRQSNEGPPSAREPKPAQRDNQAKSPESAPRETSAHAEQRNDEAK